MDSNTWVFCDSPDRDYPVRFAGTEKEMRKAVSNLQKRYSNAGCETPIFIWTGYSFAKGEEPCYELDMKGHLKKLAEAST